MSILLPPPPHQNPTWPTEWRQTMALLAHQDWMSTGDPVVAASSFDFIMNQSMLPCQNDTTGLVDFRRCERPGTGV